MMEEVNEATSAPSVPAQNIKVTEVLKDGDALTFLIVSPKPSGTGEYHVDRTYEDFEWLQYHLVSEEDVQGMQGVIFPPLVPKAQVNASNKAIKQLGILGLGEWQPYCKALETFLQQVAAHSTLSKNKALEIFLTSSDPPGRQRLRKSIFSRLSHAVEERRKEGHKDVDEFFQTERDHNILLTGCTKTATEDFLDLVLTEQKIAVACGHFSAALHLCMEPGEDPDKQAFSQACVKLSEVFESLKKNMTSVAENDMNTVGLGLEMDSRYQEAEKEMLFRRTCKLVEMENARKNAEKAKPNKKAAMEGVKRAAEETFDQICEVATIEIKHFHGVRVEMLQQALVQWCEKQLITAKESADQFSLHLQALKEMA
ncbi:sorting nexin-32 [Notolabrus celidotus]|uniref:sorting nexin-32 n=1 Tax=Notolabrus celidotus TaxID=1203425 RepID=UPI001490112D|nr:sorting nexin-32 [Notolabrus celidotus]